MNQSVSSANDITAVDRNQRTAAALATAMVDFQHLRVLAETLEESHTCCDTVFLLAQIALRIARDGENQVSHELDLLRNKKREADHA